LDVLVYPCVVLPVLRLPLLVLRLLLDGPVVVLIQVLIQIDVLLVLILQCLLGGGRRGRIGSGGAVGCQSVPVAIPVPVPVRGGAVSLRFGQQRGQRAGQRIHLMGGQNGAVGQVGLLLGEQPLQAQ
jgi:hypothetical protein